MKYIYNSFIMVHSATSHFVNHSLKGDHLTQTWF